MMLLKLIDTVFLVYWILLFVRILGSWFPEFSASRWMEFVAFYTDPYLNLFRKLIPPFGMLDLSPIFAFIALQLLQYFVQLILIKFVI